MEEESVYVRCDCLKCGGPLEVPGDYLGSEHKCPHCDEFTILVATSQEKESFPTPRDKHRRIPVWLLRSIVILLFVVAIVAVARSTGEVPENAGQGVFWLVLLFVLYFLPTLVARRSGHRNFEAIFLLNLLLGWTFLGWVAALIWAVYRDKPSPK